MNIGSDVEKPRALADSRPTTVTTQMRSDASRRSGHRIVELAYQGVVTRASPNDGQQRDLVDGVLLQSDMGAIRVEKIYREYQEFNWSQPQKEWVQAAPPFFIHFVAHHNLKPGDRVVVDAPLQELYLGGPRHARRVLATPNVAPESSVQFSADVKAGKIKTDPTLGR